MALPSPTVAPIVYGEILQGKVSAIFVPTVSNILVPTSAEMTAGTDYKNQISGMDGFSPETGTVDFPNAGSRSVPNIPGLVTLGTGTLTFNLSKITATTDARTTFNDGTDGVSTQTSGVWYFLPEGIVTSSKMRGYACTLSSSVPSMALDAPKTLTTTWAIQQVTGWLTVPTV
jgi:hypothetical protein